MITRRTLIATSLASIVAAPLLAADGDVFTIDGIAIRGTDPVAYFTEGKVIKGDASFTTMWSGATWHFSSSDNQSAFEANPEAYAPQYGGHCAYAASRGALAPTDPEAWTIRNGKLYLNFSTGVRERWLADVDANIAKADANWPNL